MDGVLRTWACQNRNCQATFEAWRDYPRCPKCKCVRTNWIPGGGHIAGKAQFIDKTLKELTGAYGMTNMHEGREGERAMPALRQQTPAPASGQMQFAPGFAGTPYTFDNSGKVRSVCMPSTIPATAKVKARTEQRLPHSGNVPGPQANTQFIASTK
jgi:hypothetical protein